MEITIPRLPAVTTVELLLCSCTSILLLIFGYAVYNAYCHPLSKFPGPRWAAMMPIWAMRAWLSGHNVQSIKALHDKYGPVVRVSPNQLSFCSATAWKDIYGHSPSRKTFRKGNFYEGTAGQVRTLVSVSDPAQHAAMRKTLSHGFSASALAAQEDLIQHYVDLLIQQLRQRSGTVVNAVKWYNFATFDIIGKLSFGEPFGALEAGESHYWMDTFFASMKALTLVRVFEYLPPVLRSFCRRVWRTKFWTRNITSASVRQSQYGRERVVQYGYFIPLSKILLVLVLMKFLQWLIRRMSRRIQQEPSRPDFLTKLIAEREKNGTSLQELTAQAGMLVRAGSETTATSLSALTYYLCRNPRVYQKLAQEIRGRFTTYEQIDAHAVGSVPYLTAVIEEGLRLFPPFAMGLPRVSPGETVDGNFIPQGAVVYVSGWAASHSEINFHQPYDFIPERWIDPECKDAKAAAQPFSLGPRGCLGRNLAMMDLRLILAKIIWTFDFKLADESFDWLAESKSYVSWQKAELRIQFDPRC